MAHVFDVARYILERQGPLTTLKLQKLIYYVQAWATVKGEPLFNDAIKAWAQGPVVPAVWQEFKGKLQVSAADVTIHGRGLSDEERAHIEGVLAHYGSLPAVYLKRLSHHERPWKDARGSGGVDDHSSPITIDALRSFYRGRTAAELDADYQMAVAREIMDEHAECFERLAR